jgi:uncharacterized protein (DUF1800 family)
MYKDQDNNRPARELRQAAVIRAARHNGQLGERMVEFWTNHFSVYTGEEDKDVRYAAASDDRDMFRAMAFGRFCDLLLANARSVSMQLYLDNFRSTGARPNQNYAREIMELHTLGASNGYDEADVEQAARLLSGWGLTGRLDTDGLRFQFQPTRHFLGPIDISIVQPDGTVSTFSRAALTPATAATGEQHGIDFINFLARQPGTARYLATKLIRRFVSDNPPPSLVASAAQVYLASDTAIGPVLRHILSSREFITNTDPKVRSPFEFIVEMVRNASATVDPAFDVTTDRPATRSISDFLNALGHPMWQWDTPDGFADVGPFWISSQSMLRRWELAGRVGNRNLNGVVIDPMALLPNPLPATINATIYMLAARLGLKITETDITAITTFLGVPTDAPTSMVNLGNTAGDIIGLLFSTPASQYR